MKESDGSPASVSRSGLDRETSKDLWKLWWVRREIRPLVSHGSEDDPLRSGLATVKDTLTSSGENPLLNL